jgi:hypothetical protein
MDLEKRPIDMKKIAFFVEGETESEFVSKLLIQLAGDKNITLKQFKFSGGGRSGPRISKLVGETAQSTAVFEAWIFISSNDERVTSDISDNFTNLSSQFHKIVGLRDLRGEVGGRALTLSDLGVVETSSRFALRTCTAIPTDIVIAVQEIETWFLAETNHYLCVDASLTEAFILSNIPLLGYNPFTDDLSQRPQATEDLNNLYSLVGQRYVKSGNSRNRDRTINCIDYANFYINTTQKLTKVGEFVGHIDSFLTFPNGMVTSL